MSVDVGEPFILEVAFDPKKVRFSFVLSGEPVPFYGLPVPFTVPFKVIVDGDITANYIGFTKPGENPAVPVGTVVTYACPYDFVFSHDWYARPSVILTCNEEGLFNEPEIWPVCIERKTDIFAQNIY